MSLLCRLKNLVHKGVLKEKDLERIVIIPKGQQEYNRLSATRDETLELGECLGLKMSLKIIDKYTAESEETDI